LIQYQNLEKESPNEPYTTQLLDVLKSHQVKATFFVVGKNALRFPAVLQRAVAEGHTIGSHTQSHSFRNYFFEPTLENEIAEGQYNISQVIGYEPKYFRAPWLWRTPLVLNTVRELGLKPIWGKFGSIIEVAQPSAQRVVRHALRRSRPGDILIFHDGYNGTTASRAVTVEAINLLIPKLRSIGYSFVTISEIEQELSTSHRSLRSLT